VVEDERYPGYSKKQISTSKLLEEYGSNSSGYFFLERARKQGLIDTVVGNSEHGHFPPVYNVISNMGQELIKGLVQ
jgi:coenzyme F420-reducing hydrogenase beta subunit